MSKSFPLPNSWVFANLKLTFDANSVTRVIWKSALHPLEVTFVRPSTGCCEADVQTEYFFYGKVNVIWEGGNLTLAPVNFGYYDLDAVGDKSWIKVQSGGVSNLKVF